MDGVVTLRANGPEIDRLIQSLSIDDSQISYAEICNRTRNLGPGLDYIAPRTLLEARNSGRITLTRLHALAHVLGVPVKQITLEADSAGATAPLPSNNLTFVLNVPTELLSTEPIRTITNIPRQTAQYFIDVALSIAANIEGTTASMEERRRNFLMDIAEGRFAARLDDIDTDKLFGATRNPEREKRFERNTRLVIEKAVQYLNAADVPEQKPDQTFLDYFIEYCQKVSDTDGQELWAQILAAKIQRPNGMSLRTLRLIQDINQNIADKFVKFCSIIFQCDGDFLSIRLDDTIGYLKWAGLKFDDLLVLSDYGLVSLGVRGFEADVGSRFRYFKHSFQTRTKLKFRANPLTTAGRELFKLADPIESKPYLEEVVKMLGLDK